MKADVLSLVGLLSNGTADQTVAGDLYDDIIEAWAGLAILTNAEADTMNAGDASFTLSASFLSILALIWNDRELGEIGLREIESIDPGWRNRIGNPSSYIIDTEAARTVRLYPRPSVPSDPDLGTYGEPMGRDYPAYSIVTIGAERRTDVPVQFELPLALLILEREFNRESDHTDPEFAQACGAIGNALLSMARGQMPQ